MTKQNQESAEQEFEQIAVVEPAHAASRLDVFLVRELGWSGRSPAKRSIENGDVRVNGRRKPKSYLLNAGDSISSRTPPATSDFLPEPNPDLDLSVLFENEHLIAIEKPAGMPSHPLVKEENNTVANWLCSQFSLPNEWPADRREHGLVHRLDNGTSGIVIAAKTAASWQMLRAQLIAAKWKKEYVALVEGKLDAPMKIDAPIVAKGKTVMVIDPWQTRLNAAEAETSILSSETRNGDSFVSISAPRATRHQVRAHLAYVGHPIVGDIKYGGRAHHKEGFCLHARYVALTDAAGTSIEIENSPSFD